MTVKLPSVLSIQRGTIVTDGIFYSTIPTDNGPDTRVPVNVVRHGIRGTNINPKKGDPANIQLTESAKTEHQANALEVEFSFATVPAEQLIFQCSDGAFRGVLDDFIQQYFVRGVPEFDELCRRYARNILNGRWLWRNRTLGGVSVLARNKGKAYHSTGSTTLHFQNYTADEQALADETIAAIAHDPSHRVLIATADAPDAAAVVQDRIHAQFPDTPITIGHIGAAIASHTGLGCVAVFSLDEKARD